VTPAAPRTTIAHLLRAIEQAKPKPVHVFTHPDDLARVTAACELLPSVKVAAHELVPAGKLYVCRDTGTPLRMTS
jgi:hypothetical protein